MRTLGSNLDLAVKAIEVEKQRVYTDANYELLDAVFQLGREIFDFVHIHEWFLKVDGDDYTLLGMLDNSRSLSINITPTDVDACIISKADGVTSRECYMTLDPSTWTDIEGWMSWARSIYDEIGTDRLYMHIPHPSKPPWFGKHDPPTIVDMATGKTVTLKRIDWYETNPRRTAIRPINIGYQPIGEWIHPPIQADGDTPQPWALANMYSGVFVPISPPKDSLITFNPVDNLPKMPPGWGERKTPDFSRMGSRVDLQNVKDDPVLGNLDVMLQADTTPTMKERVDDAIKELKMVAKDIRASKVKKDPVADGLDDLFK